MFYTCILAVGANLKVFVLQIYACEDSNKHSGAFVFLIGQLLSSIPFLFLISISSSLAFYFLIGLRDEFSLLMYFVLNFFTCLLINEGLLLAVAAFQLDVFWSILTIVLVHVSSLITMIILEVSYGSIFQRKQCYIIGSLKILV